MKLLADTWPFSLVKPEGHYSGRLVGTGDPSAIHIEGPPGAGAVLAFHGYAGSPREVRVITDAGAALGVSAHAPRLPGHGPMATSLLSVGWLDWVTAAQNELLRVAEASRSKVVVAGLSLGSLLATHLAATFREQVAGLIVLANALHLRRRTASPLLLFERFAPLDNRFSIVKKAPDIRDPVARRAHVTYDVNPIRGAVEVLRAGRIVRGELGNVICPTLVIHGALDRVCPPSNAYAFAQRLGTSDVEIAIMPSSGHIVSVDYDRQAVAAHVAAFLRRVLR
jgi:carboxylesterase